MRYDPEGPPDPSGWFNSNEADRLDAVLRQHRRTGGRTGNPRLHASIHVTVENQIAEGYAATVRTMERLLEEGLDRHDALHAIGSAVADQMRAAFQGRPFDATGYEASLAALTAASWRKSGGEAEAS